MLHASIAALTLARASGLSHSQHAKKDAPWSPARTNPYSADGLLWDGIDMLDVDDSSENFRLFGQMDTSHFGAAQELKSVHASTKNKAAVNVQILGLQNTGTNLLFTLFEKNFVGQVVFYDGSYVEKHGVWKHSNLGMIEAYSPQALDRMNEENVIPVVLVRNPLSWLQSMRKAPYELRDCVQGDDWLVKECRHPWPIGDTEGAEVIGSHTYLHLSGVWGRFTETYAPSLGNKFTKSLILSYEDLVMHTEDTIHFIALALNLTAPDVIDIVQEPAKTHGDPLGHDVAKAKIQKREFLRFYSEEELVTVCDQLMFFSNLLLEYNYDECSSVMNTSRILRSTHGTLTVISPKLEFHDLTRPDSEVPGGPVPGGTP